MNTGLQDAHNLAWKLAVLLQHSHPNSDDDRNSRVLLLDSYEAERRPVAAHNAVLSLRNYERSLRVPQALGLDVDQAKALAESAAALGEGVASLPKAVVESVLAMGRRPLRSLATPGQPYGAACLKAARRVLADGAGLPLLFPHDDLGFCYSGPLVPSSREGTGNGGHQEQGATEREAEALTGFPLPATAAIVSRLGALVEGARVPHFTLRTEGAGGLCVSTTDLAEQLHVACRLTRAEEETDALLAPAGPFAVLLHLPGPAAGHDDDLREMGPALAVTLPDGSGTLPLVRVEVVSPPSPPEQHGQKEEAETVLTMPPAAWPARAREGLCACIMEARAVRLVDSKGSLTRAMVQQGVRGVFVRPDGHVLGLVMEGEGLVGGDGGGGLRVVGATE